MFANPIMTVHWIVYLVFHPAPRWSSSAPTSSTFSPSAPAFPTARCGSPPPRWTTPPWRPCSSASSPFEICMSKAGQPGSHTCPRIPPCLPMRKRKIRNDEEQWTKKKVTFSASYAQFFHSWNFKHVKTIVIGSWEIKFFGENVVYCKAWSALCWAPLVFWNKCDILPSVPVGKC